MNLDPVRYAGIISIDKNNFGGLYQCLRQLFFKGKSIIDTQNPSIPLTGITLELKASSFIGKCGGFIMVIFQSAMKFITGTGIQPITILVILNSLNPQSISRNFIRYLRTADKRKEATLKEYVHLLASGTVHRKAKNGIVKSSKRDGQPERRASTIVFNAAKYFIARIFGQKRLSIAPINVKGITENNQGQKAKLEFVRNASSPSQLINTRRRKLVRLIVRNPQGVSVIPLSGLGRVRI